MQPGRNIKRYVQNGTKGMVNFIMEDKNECRKCEKYSFDYNSSSGHLWEFCDIVRFDGPLSDGKTEKLCEKEN